VLPFIKKNNAASAAADRKTKKQKAKRKKRSCPVKRGAQERKGEKKCRYSWRFLFVPFEPSTVFYLFTVF